MSKRNLYHANIVGFSLDLETDKDMVNLSGVYDSNGDLVSDSMCLLHGAWSSNLESGSNISFTAKMKSQVKRQFIDGVWYNVRECYLYNTRRKT